MEITSGEDISKLNDLDFTEILKACLIRLQDNDGDIVRVGHNNYGCSSVILSYIDEDSSDPYHISWPDGNLRVYEHTLEINTH